jgi:hypothetical protein
MYVYICILAVHQLHHVRHLYTHMHKKKYYDIYIYMCVYINIDVYVYILDVHRLHHVQKLYTHTYIHTHTHTYTHAHKHTHKHNTHTHTHTHAHTHMVQMLGEEKNTRSRAKSVVQMLARQLIASPTCIEVSKETWSGAKETYICGLWRDQPHRDWRQRSPPLNMLVPNTLRTRLRTHVRTH